MPGGPAFVKSGSQEVYCYHNRASNKNQSLFSGVTDWEMAADLPEWRKYPDFIKKTNMRPDIVLYSEDFKKVIIVELTVPYESRIDYQHQYKTAKYADLAAELKKVGFSSKILALEVGARRFVGASVFSGLGELGIRGRKRTRAMKSLAETAEKSSKLAVVKAKRKMG